MKLNMQVGLAVFLFLFAGVASAQDMREASLSNVQGEVLVRQGAGDWMPATSGMKITTADEIKTSARSSVDVLLDAGNVGDIQVKEKSVFKIDTMDIDPATGDKMTNLNLALGRILVHAQKLQGNSKFEVKTPTSTTGVRGTVFEVTVN